MNFQELQKIIKSAQSENNKGNYDDAERVLDEYLVLLQQEPVSAQTFEFRAMLKIALAQNAWLRGNFEMAQVHSQEAIMAVDAEVQPDSVKYVIHAKANNIIGLVNWNTSNYTKALEYYTSAIEAAGKINDRLGVAMITGNIGIVYSKLEDYERAYSYYTKALAVHEELGMKSEVANVTCNIGIMYRSQEEYPLALECFIKALSLHQSLGMKTEAARMMGNIGSVYFSLHQFPLALEYYQKALAEFESMDLKADIAIILGHIGGLYAANEFDGCDPQKAIDYVLRALEIDEKLGMKQDLYENHQTLAMIYKEQKDWERFSHHFEKYHDIEKEVNSEESLRLAQRLAIQHDLALIQREQDILREKNAELNELNQELELKNEQLLLLNVEKNEFLGIASHDLKNPLSAITMIANALATDTTSLSYDEIREMAEDISASSKRMYQLIINLLDINKIEQGNMFAEKEVFSVADYTHRAIEHHRPAALGKNIGITVDIIDAQMEASPLIYTQILDNLISNAVKFSQTGTAVHVRMLLRNETTIQIRVQDQGPGLTEDDKSKLFKKFSKLSARPTGGELSTGLGLSIVKKLVESMNGTIWCESTIGEGATFVVEFPVYVG
ncbi:MAG: tetratricopeptide repeat-containing sensor histidine kinase [Candidatus Kapaibacterium sp.]